MYATLQFWVVIQHAYAHTALYTVCTLIAACTLNTGITVCLQELVAAEWVGMLKHGVLDADIYPEKATVIIDMLWSVTSNSSARVSACNNSPMCTSTNLL